MYNIVTCKDKLGTEPCKTLIKDFGCGNEAVIKSCEKSCQVCVESE